MKIIDSFVKFVIRIMFVLALLIFIVSGIYKTKTLINSDESDVYIEIEEGEVNR